MFKNIHHHNLPVNPKTQKRQQAKSNHHPSYRKIKVTRRHKAPKIHGCITWSQQSKYTNTIGSQVH